MGSLLVVAVIALVTVSWVRGVRKRRDRWVRKLALPGVWISQDETRTVIELLGEWDHGNVRVQGLGKGQWRLEGSLLIFELEDQRQTFELTYYDAGKVGLESAPGQRRYFQKQASNVIPLNRRA